MRDYQQEVLDLEREIKDLKTAQIKPSNSAFYPAVAVLPAGTWSGSHTWTIQYEDVGDDTAPITISSFDGFTSFQPYDAANNQQKLEWYSTSATFASNQTYIILSSRPIASITFNG